MNLVVRIPDELARRLRVDGSDLERQALEALVLESYRAGRMSTDELREALGLEASPSVGNFLEAHGVLEPRQSDTSDNHTVTLPVEEYLRLKRRDRQVHRVEDLPEDIIELIARTKMDPRHDHLNSLLDDWTS